MKTETMARIGRGGDGGRGAGDARADTRLSYSLGTPRPDGVKDGRVAVESTPSEAHRRRTADRSDLIT